MTERQPTQSAECGDCGHLQSTGYNGDVVHNAERRFVQAAKLKSWEAETRNPDPEAGHQHLGR
jgi:hypothetical protein